MYVDRIFNSPEVLSLTSQTKPGPNMALAVARKSALKDSMDEHDSVMASESFWGTGTVVGDCKLPSVNERLQVGPGLGLLTIQLKKKWLL